MSWLGLTGSLYTALGVTETIPDGSFSDTPNSYGQYEGEYNESSYIYAQPGDLIVATWLVFNNYYTSQFQAYPLDNGSVPLGECYVGTLNLLNPPQEVLSGQSWFMKALCLYQGEGAPPANNYQDSRNS